MQRRIHALPPLALLHLRIQYVEVQGTLDLRILKIAALGPVHGYAMAQRLQQVSRDVLVPFFSAPR
jgi:hypothetical protein